MLSTDQPETVIINGLGNNLDNMASNAKHNILTIPAELRLMIWELVFPKLDYFGGADHHKCPYTESLYEIAGKVSTFGISALTPCPCNNRQLQPLWLCKQGYREMKHVMDKVPINADYTSQYWHLRLQPRLEQRVRSLTLDETVYPVISCGRGILEHVLYDDFLAAFPNLDKITMPERLGSSGMGLSFPTHMPEVIYECLRSRGGPDELPTADMTETVRADLDGRGHGELFEFTWSIVLAAGMDIVSTYRYKISVSQCLEWPLGPSDKEVYNKDFCGVSCPRCFPLET